MEYPTGLEHAVMERAEEVWSALLAARRALRSLNATDCANAKVEIEAIVEAIEEAQ